MTPNQINMVREALGLPNKWNCVIGNLCIISSYHPDYRDWIDLIICGYAVVSRKTNGKSRDFFGLSFFRVTQKALGYVLTGDEIADLCYFTMEKCSVGGK